MILLASTISVTRKGFGTQALRLFLRLYPYQRLFLVTDAFPENHPPGAAHGRGKAELIALLKGDDAAAATTTIPPRSTGGSCVAIGVQQMSAYLEDVRWVREVDIGKCLSTSTKSETSRTWGKVKNWVVGIRRCWCGDLPPLLLTTPTLPQIQNFAHLLVGSPTTWHHINNNSQISLKPRKEAKSPVDL